jgi:hypothetical protein
MKFRSAEQITKQLTAAGVSEADAKLYAGGAKLSGEKAREYMKATPLPEITPAQQKALFAIAYAEIEASTKKICESEAVVAKYGKVDWEKLHPTSRDLVIDLRYRGDYTVKTREVVQPLIVKNDLKTLAEVLADREKWPKVTLDRFTRRAEYAKKALQDKPSQ